MLQNVHLYPEEYSLTKKGLRDKAKQALPAFSIDAILSKYFFVAKIFKKGLLYFKKLRTFMLNCLK